MEEDAEKVDLAYKSLRKGVQSYCRRFSKLPPIAPSNDDDNSKKKIDVQLPRDVVHLLNHMSHSIRQLIARRKSLRNGFTFLQQTLWPKVVLKEFRSNMQDERTAAASLEHFLTQCLRLNDGIVLLESGECRHSGDIQAAKRGNKFPSHLDKQDLCADGYTSLYKAPGGYSGYGIDEFRDQKMGLQTRLCEALQVYSKKRKSCAEIWDYIVEHGGEMFESQLDQHVSEIGQVQMARNALRDQVVRDLKQCFNGSRNVKVLFKLDDKMEKLLVGKIQLERRADAFQIQDPKGVLPGGYSIQDWSSVMKLPDCISKKLQEIHIDAGHKSSKKSTTTVVKKRRLVIVDEDSDEENDDDKSDKKTICDQPKPASVIAPKVPAKSQTPVAQPAASAGLTVKIRKDATPPEKSSAFSLATIKAQMGADVQALEAAREEVEREEAGATKAAKEEEMDATATTVATASIQEGRAAIKQQRRILDFVQNRAHVDVKEVWDAREVLREQLMTVGNQYLWEQDASSSHRDRERSLLLAYRHFVEAKKVCEEQEQFRKDTFAPAFYTPREARFLSRKILLLMGRAHANLGITNIELATLIRTQNKAESSNDTLVESDPLLKEAETDLSTAKDFADCLRTRAKIDPTRGSPTMETAMDGFLADSLEALALRWLATTLWHKGLRTESAEKFEAASAFILDSSRIDSDLADDPEIHQTILELGAECYVSCMVAADLAQSAMDQLPSTGAIQEGDELFSSYVKKNFQRASSIIKAIRAFFESHPNDDVTFDEYMEENQMKDQQALAEGLKEFEDWWGRRKSNTNTAASADPLLPKKVNAELPRSDMEPLVGLGMLPATRIFTVSSGASRRARPKRKGTSGNARRAAPRAADSTDDTHLQEYSLPTEFEPWGDELLPQTIDEETGRSIPKLEYPSICPPMPDYIKKALLEANSSQLQ